MEREGNAKMRRGKKKTKMRKVMPDLSRRGKLPKIEC
jgi:hypothetical protein